MTARFMSVAGALALAFASFACSRQAAEPRPPSDAQSLTPAAGSVARDAGAASRPRCKENFAAFDDDGDGRVSQDEFGAQPHAHPDPLAVFRERDRDGDGSLSEEEFCSGWRGAARADRPGGPGARSGPGGGPGPATGQGPGRRPRRQSGPMLGARCEQHFDSFDADHDQKLTLDEFAAWPHSRGDAATLFGERDLDHDGTITRTEFCSAWTPPAR